MKNKTKKIWTLALVGLALNVSTAKPFADGASKARPAQTYPNLLVIVTDDMSYDQLSLGQHPFMKTPNLDQLAAEGVQFTHAYATSPYCAPSRASPPPLLISRQTESKFLDS